MKIGRAYTDDGYDSSFWKLRLMHKGWSKWLSASFTRRRWVRWRRFINRYRRTNRNHPDLHRNHAWDAFRGASS